MYKIRRHYLLYCLLCFAFYVCAVVLWVWLFVEYMFVPRPNWPLSFLFGLVSAVGLFHIQEFFVVRLERWWFVQEPRQ